MLKFLSNTLFRNIIFRVGESFSILFMDIHCITVEGGAEQNRMAVVLGEGRSKFFTLQRSYEFLICALYVS